MFWRGVLSDLAVMTVVGLFLGILGPFGTNDQPIAVRIISWLGFAYIGYVLYRPMSPVVDWLEKALVLPRPGLWLGAVMVSTLPMTVAVLVIGNPQAPLRWPGIEIALTSYFYVFMIGGAVTILFSIIGSRGQAAGQAPPPPAQSYSPVPVDQPDSGTVAAATPFNSLLPNPLMDAIPADLGTDILALEMEDHYVRVHTALGSELVLMRLRDAMACVTDIEGRQTHRSWWVARGAVEDIVREGRNVRLRLARGIEAPVSRAQISELRDAGWI